MLCYQYSRNATEIIHDTFRWLRDNGRVMRMMTLLLLPLSLVAQWLSAEASESRHRDLFDTLVQFYFPAFDDSQTGSSTVQTFHYVALLVVVMAFVPILRHYFLTRKSVNHITLPRMGQLAMEHKKSALWVAILSVVTYFLASLLLKTVVFGYVVLFFAVFPVSASIMHGVSWRFEGLTDNWLLTIRYLFLVSFVVLVLQVLPLYTLGLVGLAIEMLDETVGFVVPNLKNMGEEVTFVMGVLSYLMFGYSMVVLFVSLTLFHGTVAEEE